MKALHGEKIKDTVCTLMYLGLNRDYSGISRHRHISERKREREEKTHRESAVDDEGGAAAAATMVIRVAHHSFYSGRLLRSLMHLLPN